MGLAAFEDTKTKETLSTNAQFQELVTRVGQRIAKVAERPDYKWEFRLVASAEQNAYCLPGGKVTVNEGILPVCGNEAGLAVVMSHEISHAIARHGGERMSHSMAVDGAKRAVEYFTKDREQREKDLILQAYGLGTQYGVVLPYSRKHEYEADHMGLILMAKSGYDPAEAPRFWARFAKLKEGNSPSEFLSTHPTDAHREENLTKLLVDAQTQYAKSTEKFGLGEDFSAAAASLAAAAAAAQPPVAAPQSPSTASPPPVAASQPASAGTEAPGSGATQSPATPTAANPLGATPAAATAVRTTASTSPSSPLLPGGAASSPYVPPPFVAR